MIFKKLSSLFCTNKHTTFSAHKYMKSVTETALLYRPQKIINLHEKQNIRDRVVQTFFDSTNVQIGVTQAVERQKDVSIFSTPSHSFYQINLPFHFNHVMRRKMSQFSSPSIRVGRLLELMDYIASNVAFRYCIPDNGKQFDIDSLDFIVVTAAVDEIQFYYPIQIDIDCLLSGYVAYVGKSSIQVHIDVMQKIDGNDRLACSANFVMVARNKKTGKAYEVPRLSFEKERSLFKIINQLGEQRQLIRKNQSRRNLLISPPTYQESVIVHKLNQSLKVNNFNYRPISSTTLKNTMLMHIEDKNLSGKIFGGLILRISYELGWLCATKFLAKSIPILSLVDQVQFLAPVEVGTYIELDAYVGYVTDRFVHVIVNCFNSELSGKKVQTNLLHITFQHSQGNSVEKVYPESLSQSYTYIESLRRVKKLTHIQS